MTDSLLSVRCYEPTVTAADSLSVRWYEPTLKHVVYKQYPPNTAGAMLTFWCDILLG